MRLCTLCRQGVPLSDMETILRIIQCKAIVNQASMDKFMAAEDKSMVTMLLQNTINIYGNYPNNLWNISLLADFVRGLPMKLPTGETFDICKVQPSVVLL